MKKSAHPFLIPGEGLMVLKPEGVELNPAGEEIVLTGYWRRRIACGDVVVGKQPKQSGSQGSGSTSSK